MACEFKGAKVAICGSFGGIGQAICRELLENGVSHLAALDLTINADVLKEWKQSYPNLNIFAEVLDVTKKVAVDSVLGNVKNEMGGLDIIINCSGILNEKDPESTVQVNLLGTIYVTLAAIELMGTQTGGRGGTIVSVASVLGIEPCTAVPVYSASKHGVVGFMRSFSSDVHFNATGIRFLTICPGMTYTNILCGSENRLIFDYTKEWFNGIMKAKAQEADICGKNIVKAIQNGKHGSMWMCDLGSLSEINMAKYWDFTF